MANRRRGEVSLTLGGRRYTLCLTLGALAELEDALRAEDLAGLAGRLASGRPRTGDLIALPARPCGAAAMTFRTRGLPPAPRG